MSSRNDKRTFVNDPKTLIVSIDVSKDTLDVAIGSAQEDRPKPFKVANDLDGFGELFERVEKKKGAGEYSRIIAAWEPTGAYSDMLMYYLSQHTKWELVQVQPREAYRFREAAHGWRGKSDAMDTIVIHQMVRLGRFYRLVVPKGPFRELRALSGHLDRLAEDGTRLHNRIHALVAKMYPGLSRWIREGHNVSLRAVLKRSPLPQELAQLDAEKLGQELKLASRGQFAGQAAQAIVVAARRYVAETAPAASALGEEMKQAVEDLDRIEQRQAKAQEQVSRWLAEIPYAAAMLTIPYCSEAAAASYLGEWGDLRGYANEHQVLDMAGITLYEISSGKKKGCRHISKRGRPALRRRLFLHALSWSQRKGDPVSAYYQRGIDPTSQKGDGERLKRMVAVAAKIARIVFAVARTGKPYDAKRLVVQAA